MRYKVDLQDADYHWADGPRYIDPQSGCVYERAVEQPGERVCNSNVRFNQESGCYESPGAVSVYKPIDLCDPNYPEDNRVLAEAALVEAPCGGKTASDHDGKADAGRPPVFRGLLDYFPRACLEVAELSGYGAKKYEWKGWENVPDAEARYRDALSRHILKRSIEGDLDKDWFDDYGKAVLHDAAVAWNALAVLELTLREAANR